MSKKQLISVLLLTFGLLSLCAIDLSYVWKSLTCGDTMCGDFFGEKCLKVGTLYHSGLFFLLVIIPTLTAMVVYDG
jgi:hypothetical protein